MFLDGLKVLVETAGSGGCTGGVGGSVDEAEHEYGTGAGVFGMVPKVDGISEECTVLVGVPDDVDEGRGVTEVLAFGGLDRAMVVRAKTGGAWMAVVVLARMNSAVPSPPVMVIHLNLNLGMAHQL